MFGKLPEIFGRDFAIGYFLPSAIFLGVNINLLSGFVIALPVTLGEIFKDAVILGLLSWLGGIFLLAINRILIRTIEGYGRFNPAQLFKRIEKNRFAKLQAQITGLNLQRDEYQAKGEKLPAELQAQRDRLIREAAERFPDQSVLLLPTAFGNTIRAFEVYSRVIYGFESIYGWNRLLAVISKEYRELVDAAKTQMDFWVNLLFLSVLTIFEYTTLTIYTRHLSKHWWIGIAAFCVAAISYTMARSAAVAWGDLVKASFDVYLPELRKKLEFPFPINKREEKALWTGFSQSIIYRLHETMPERVQQPKEKP